MSEYNATGVTLSVPDILNEEDGTYSVTRDKDGVLRLVNYAEKWAYGYIVGVKKLEFSDIHPGNLVGVWTSPETGLKEYDVVKHVDILDDAKRLGRDHDQKTIWDLRESREVYLR